MHACVNFVVCWIVCVCADLESFGSFGRHMLGLATISHEVLVAIR